MRIHDLVVLGRACPEPLKDGRITVCLAGHSQEHGFIRLYPTRAEGGTFRQWDIIEVDVERDDRDNRAESWKIAGSNDDWAGLSDKFHIVGHLESLDARRKLLHPLTVGCVNDLNDSKRSLGIVQPDEILKTYFKDNPNYGELFQRRLFEQLLLF